MPSISPTRSSPLRSPNLNFPIRIIPASTQDIPTLAYIHVEALKDDASAAVKFAEKDEFQAKVEEMLRGQIVSDGDFRLDGGGGTESHVGKWVVVKAVVEGPDDGGESGQEEKIVGWASWLHEDPASATEETPREDQSNHTSHDSLQNDARNLMAFPTGLGAYVRRNQTHMYKSWHQQHLLNENEASDSNGFLSFRACFVLSSFQHLGIGKALVKYGCERADRLLLNILVTATPSGKELYERVGGFVVFGDLRVDLDRRSWGDDRIDTEEGPPCTLR